MQRLLSVGSIYHICNKSIANYQIFKSNILRNRFLQTIYYYNNLNVDKSLSTYLKTKTIDYDCKLLLAEEESSLVKLLVYCVMPDHYHLLVKVLVDGCIPHFINTIQNSYTRYFNLKYKRKGPLWQSQYRYVYISNNEQLLHVSRYIHLNPTTSNLVNVPEKWKWSSYYEYINNPQTLKNIYEISIRDGAEYKKFTNNQIEYQRTLRLIKTSILD